MGWREHEETRMHLVRDTFEEILRTLAKLGLYRYSPKFFVIYAHDNPQLANRTAQASTVKDFISWFKLLQLDVDSDTSPHGNVANRGEEHVGASNDIVNNQLCHLPRSWDSRNASHVITFGSELLGKYMTDMASLKLDGKTYTEAIVDGWTNITQSEAKDRQIRACEQIKAVQRKYSEHMGGSFHHVLTELALMEFRDFHDGGALSRITQIPLLLSGDAKTCFPPSITKYDTLLRIDLDPCIPHVYEKGLFKILLRFGEFEKDRPLVEAMARCFDQCVKKLGEAGDATRHQLNCAEIMLQTLRDLNNSGNYEMMERKITAGDIRGMLDLHTLLDNSSILRISGEKLPEDVADVNLIVSPVKRNGEKEDAESNNVETIAPTALFQRRMLSDNDRWISPKRILIQGRPGAGKSTLSRRWMYKYSYDTKLRIEQTRKLDDLLFEEFFEVIPRGRQFATKLQQLILEQGEGAKTSPWDSLNKRQQLDSLPGDAPNDGQKSETAPPKDALKILFILDGLDELRGGPDYSTGHSPLAKQLINQPIVVVTSRYDTSGSSAINPMDLRLSVVGLSMENVWAYIENKGINTADDSSDLRKFVEKNQLIQGMMKVRIHLGLLCYSWDELRAQAFTDDDHYTEQTTAPTSTQFYQAIEQKLWRKDIPSLKKCNHGEPLTSEIVNAVRSWHRLEPVVQAEISILGRIAVGLAETSRLSLMERDIDWAIRQTEEAQQTHFAQSPRSLKEHLRNHKYNRRYEAIWRFVAGLLSSNSDKLELFFQDLETEPRDLIGTHHVYLLIRCLSQCQNRLNATRLGQKYQLKEAPLARSTVGPF
ncbi:hypothetical protein B0T22DRAFT_515406 [Podospora appendiculata]|uniref:DUF7068 domain-containing protein n=1 Tax=Podospora appendiculata TaxID=314037 RepID=A0AAE1CE21_9PEZI|nr:hypothetical protein B0T22DRAFT_515406 [Podospora appendiculata]